MQVYVLFNVKISYSYSTLSGHSSSPYLPAAGSCSCCRRSISDWSVNLSMSSISHFRYVSFLMARYRWTKACRLPDVWSSANRSLHCCCGSSLILSSALMSSAPRTSSWNKKSMTLAGLTLLTTVKCSFLNFSFKTSFDSRQNI